MEKQQHAVTINDVAREAQVSLATVSRVVNGNSNVKEDTRRRVKEVIEKLNYRPNAVARGLASKKSTTIGLIISDLTDAYYSNLAKGIDDVAEMYNYNIIFSTIDHGNKINVIDNLLSNQVDGFVYLGNNMDEEVRNKLISSKIPTVLAGNLDEKRVFPSVNIDYEKSAYDITELLIKNGNSKVAFVGYNLQGPIDGQHRLSGYKRALRDNNIKFDSELVFEAPISSKSGKVAWDAVRNHHATAAIVSEDVVASSMLNAAIDDGYKVPDDFEIITSYDTVFCELARPALSSVSQPLYDIGAVSMRLLTKLMNSEEVSETQIVLPYELIERKSTK